MRHFLGLTGDRVTRLRPFLSKSQGKPRFGDGRPPSGIVFIGRNGYRWPEAPGEQGPPKTPGTRMQGNEMTSASGNCPEPRPARRCKCASGRQLYALQGAEEPSRWNSRG